MTLLRLSLVTETLLALLKRAVESSPEWPGAAITLSVSPDPPDRLTGDHTIGLYLYHAVEDPARRNAPPAGDASLPLRHSPMPLLLHYVLSAHSDLQTVGAASLEEQFLMGLAMKALRDVPRIDDDTAVAGTTLMPVALAGRGNRFLITPQAVPAADAVAYWTAGQHALRMAAYYEVAAVLFEPDTVPSRTGRVLTYGVHTIARGAPRLSGSRNVVRYSVPGDPTPRTAELKPAQAAIGDSLELIGSELAGDETRLMLQHPLWDDAVEVDSSQWGVVPAPDHVSATIQADAGSEPVLPGIYGVSATVVGERSLPGGGVREITARSNVTPIAVTPAITAIAGPDASQRVIVDGGRFDPLLLPDDDIEVFIGADRLSRTAAAATTPGQFRIIDRDQLELRLPTGSVSGATLPLRIVVRGTESPPRWVTVP